MEQRVMIAVAVVVLLAILAIWYMYRSRSSSKYTAQAAAAIWGDGVQCADDTLKSGYCIVDESKAVAICDKDPTCIGYVKPTMDNVKADGIWSHLPAATPVQLVTATRASTQWPGTVFYQKPTKSS